MSETKPLGEIKKTERGFELIQFVDRYGEPCTLQQSSLADFEPPGSSAVWLGQGQDRMHLDIERVRSLVTHLAAWLETGSLEPRP